MYEINLRDRLDQYVKSHPDLSPGRVRTLKYRVDHFSRVAKLPDFGIYRQIATKLGYSPSTIESTVDVVARLAELERGKPLRISAPDPHPPTVSQVSAIYSHADVARWSPIKSHKNWWRAFFVVACWTALRRSDLLRLTIDDFQDHVLRVRAAKTGRSHRIPCPPFVLRHMTAAGSLQTKSLKQFRRELRRICRAAGVEPITPQHLRQFGITQWSAINATAGRLIHGCGLGGRDVMQHYVDTQEILDRAAPRVRIPDVFFTEEERRDRQAAEERLVDRFRRVSDESKKVLLRVAEGLS